MTSAEETSANAMPDDPVEFIRQLRQVFTDESGESRIFSDPEVFVRTIEPHATDDFSALMNGGALTTHYEGVEGLRAGWADFLAAFDTIQVLPGEMRVGADGACVVEFVNLKGKPAGIDSAIDQPASAVWRLRDGRIHAVEFIIDQKEALRAAGLDPENPGPAVDAG